MRTHLLIINLFSSLFFASSVFGQDLPGAPPNIENIKSGSYVIPMDEFNQSITNGNTTAINVRAYGLVYALLNNNIPIKWVIKSGKERQDIDFTASSRRIFPNESTISSSIDYKHGAFVISVDDFEINSCVNGISSAQSTIDDLIRSYGGAVNVNVLEEDVNVDVEYTLRFAPKVAILNDGGYAEEHESIFDLARIPYTSLSSAEFFQDYSCFTYITQPHLELIRNASYIPSLNEFLDNGGNFLAQCSSVGAFEDAGFFQSTNGFLYSTTSNSNISYTYINNEMPLIQIAGELESRYFGTLSNYWLRGSGEFLPSTYSLLENQIGRTIMSVGDLNGDARGGNVIYLGGHSPSTFDLEINGEESAQVMQMVLNGAFLPANVAFACAGNDQCICEGDGVEIGCSGGDNTLVYDWSPTEGLSCSDCPNPIASPSSTMTYTLNVSNGLSGACSQDQVTIQVREKSELELVFDVCPGESIDYNGTRIFGGNVQEFTFEGSNGCDSIVMVNVRSYEPVLDTLDFVSCDGSLIAYNGDMLPAGTLRDYIFTDVNGCDSTVTVRVRTFYSQALDFKVCSDENIAYNGDVLSPGSTTEYTFVAADGCDSIVTVRINQTEITADLQVEGISCFGFDDGQVLAENTFGGSRPYQYSLDNLTFQEDSLFNDLAPGDYFIYFLDAIDCLDSLAFVVNDVQDWVVTAEVSEDTIIAGTPTSLFAVSDYIGTLSYEWTPSLGLSCTDCSNPTASPSRSTTYTITATDENGCVKTDVIDITVLQTMTFLPNVFTPNGDQINDTFFPQFRGEVESVQLSIFDRWGGLLYYSEDPYESWDGIYRGQALMQGVYVYQIKTIFRSGYIEKLSGDITLLR